MFLERVSPTSARQMREVDHLLQAGGLTREAADLFVIGYERGTPVACGALAGNVIKMLAVDQNRQSSGRMTEIVSALVSIAAERGCSDLFLFTKSEYAQHFHGIGFQSIADTGTVILFHRGETTPESALRNLLHQPAGTPTHAIVMNANPMTNGHLHLIDQAGKGGKPLLVFVVEEEGSEFSFADRLGIVKEAVSDRSNVRVLPSSPYAISPVTFPTYFLKEASARHREYARLDALLFKTYFVPHFSIEKRFVGEEPVDGSTRIYNEVLRETLPPLCEVVEIPRLSAPDGEPISASRIRQWMRERKAEAIRPNVPPASWKVIQRYADFTG